MPRANRTFNGGWNIPGLSGFDRNGSSFIYKTVSQGQKVTTDLLAKRVKK